VEVGARPRWHGQSDSGRRRRAWAEFGAGRLKAARLGWCGQIDSSRECSSTPLFQVELCGHTTLASAHFLFTSVDGVGRAPGGGVASSIGESREFLAVVGQAASGASVTIKNEAFEGGGGRFFHLRAGHGGRQLLERSDKTICPSRQLAAEGANQNLMRYYNGILKKPSLTVIS
jgi:hypothetical protein